YDGSASADDMLDELGRAGLPGEVEAVVLSVTERWLPPPSMYETMIVGEVPHARPGTELAEAAAERLMKRNPQWRVTHESATGSPAKTLLRRAREWGADLIAVGSVGHGSLERALVGSVSHKIANSAACSVRVSRGYLPDRQGPVRLVIAHDGQPGADVAVDRVAGRIWPAGSQVRLIACAATHSPAEAYHWTHDVFEKAAARLQARGLAVSSSFREGDPRRVIVEEAARFDAECVFAGDNDRSVMERLLLGTVSSAILARAHCAVEICR
ncbi:MAG: universal stress protein, partial [Bryobacterales bacterium]|nr:universal stress protein [Bryobacterales bacterium]